MGHAAFDSDDLSPFSLGIFICQFATASLGHADLPLGCFVCGPVMVLIGIACV